MPAPLRIVAGRVVLQLHGPDEAGAVADVINANLEHLRPWMPWAHRETDAHEQAMRLAVAIENAERDRDLSYTITVDGRIAGGCGLHRRDADERTLDIGYWIAADAEGHGYVTEAAAGLAHVAFERYEARLIRITCDEANVRSAAVPRRLGFAHVDTVDEERDAPASSNRTMIWELTREAWTESPGRAIAVSYA